MVPPLPIPTPDMTIDTAAKPILYSFRRCPYAMRARLAIHSAQLSVELREVSLKNKPAALLQASAKGTVPVLDLGNGQIIDESLDIMFWALRQHDPEHWLAGAEEALTLQLIQDNDGEFKYYLDRYKYADRYPEHPANYYRQRCERFLAELDRLLRKQGYLTGTQFTLADAAILPFIRQFAAVDNSWFEQTAYQALQQWLKFFIHSPRLQAIMHAYEPWTPNTPLILFGCYL